MTFEELEILETYNRNKAVLERDKKGKLDSLDNFRKNISTDNGVTIYFTIEDECKNRRSYDNIHNPIISMIRTANMDVYNKHEELGKKSRARARKFIDLITEKCKEEQEQKLAILEVELKNSLELINK